MGLGPTRVLVGSKGWVIVRSCFCGQLPRGRLLRGRLLQGGPGSCRCVRGNTFYCIEPWLELVIASVFVLQDQTDMRSPIRFGGVFSEAFFLRSATHVPLDRPNPEKQKRGEVNVMDPSHSRGPELKGCVFDKGKQIGTGIFSKPRPKHMFDGGLTGREESGERKKRRDEEEKDEEGRG